MPAVGGPEEQGCAKSLPVGIAVVLGAPLGKQGPGDVVGDGDGVALWLEDAGAHEDGEVLAVFDAEGVRGFAVVEDGVDEAGAAWCGDAVARRTREGGAGGGPPQRAEPCQSAHVALRVLRDSASGGRGWTVRRLIAVATSAMPVSP